MSKGLAWLLGLAALFALAAFVMTSFAPSQQRHSGAPPQYAFIGDSLTAWTDWGPRLGGAAVVNLAVAGATIDMIARQAAAVGAYRAPVVLVAAGTNDIVQFGRSAARIRQDYEALLRRCPPNATLVVTLIPYTSERALNASIAEANVHVRQLAEQRGARIVDLNPLLAPAGVLAPEFTTDGLHFSDRGYDLWADEIRRVLAT
ncbi:MAG: hypothetical protein JNJ73_16055 [Hyphomonadaceae bacterium]|nr:hypothetical protein [Hyphomonadaceae bacterium]